MRIALTSIFVDDQDQAEEFYTQVLGFQIKTNAAYGPNERWLSVVAPEGILTGSSWCCTAPTSPRGRFRLRQPGARPAGAVVAHRRLRRGGRAARAKGVVFVKEPGRMAYGGMDAVFADTCGNLLNLHQD